MKKLELFFLLLVVWVLLVWPFDPQAGGASLWGILTGGWQDVLVGVLMALLATFLMREVIPDEDAVWIDPERIFWLLCYAVVLAGYIVKANVDVAYRVMHPDMPIRPGIVKVKTNLKKPAAITMLANSIPLPPGTLTVNALADGTLYVHWIFVETEDSDEAAKSIIGRFEWFLQRIFE